MRIAIVGAGIVGAATAYELAGDGHEVVVLERHASAAEQASFANPGLLAPALLIPWAAPGTGGPVLRQFTGRQGTLRLTRGAGLHSLAWLWRWARAAGQPQCAGRLLALAHLGRYSLGRTREVAGALQADIETSRGMLVLLRSSGDLELVQAALAALREAGAGVHQVDADTARLIEPGLATDVPLAGALHAVDGEAGNCRVFAQQLRQAAQERGARFVFNARIQALSTTPTGVVLAGESTVRPADAVVLCAGEASAGLLRPLGARLPMQAVHGYSISAPVREDTHAPQGAVIDPLHRIVITRQGQRVRVSGGAELGHAAGVHHAPTLRTLYLALSGWFPGGVLTSSPQVQVWRGARPTLADGAPVIGAGPVPGVWVNAGHGASGWAQACGSARALADLIGGRSPALDLQPFSLARF
ncbi:FAD-dependent oxidoreductase [Melaminivora sp.]|uniref:FAD-dependent oxidoreductase n=1 Tax=Melaminivora sp. TaxID=1933032 RepID=UPI0028ACE5F4|nr:FAD-dependent oxidoreductase [Melaminivora sp.]